MRPTTITEEHCKGVGIPGTHCSRLRILWTLTLRGHSMSIHARRRPVNRYRVLTLVSTPGGQPYSS